MRAYGSFRKIYHSLVPESVRRQETLARLAQRLTSRFAEHDVIYTEAYYRDSIQEDAAKAAPLFSKLVVEQFHPRRVVDVGCGTGAILEALREAGCETLGLEYSEAGLQMCRIRGLDVQKFDLERDDWAGSDDAFDVALSLEVAEHLPERVADSYVSLLARLAPALVFTAAAPGQGGVDHVNEQPHEYWVEKLEARGQRFDPAASAVWQRELRQGGAAKFYYQNLMVFRRGGSS